MTGLFSGASTYEGSQQLGRAGFNLAMTIWGKLDEAEAVSQYQTGQQLLQANINKFDQQLAQDPEIDTWADKNTQAMNDAWAETEKVIKNPRALNQLNEWWVNQGLSRSNQLNDRIISAKTNKLLGQFRENIDATMNDDSMDSAQKKGRMESLGQAASATMVVDPKAWETERERLFKTLDKNDLLSAGLQVMKDQGKEAGLQWMLDPKNSDNLTEQDRKSLSSSAADSYQLVLTVQGKKADAKNKENVGTALDWILTDQVPEDAYSQIAKMQFQSVPEAGIDGTAEKTRAYELIKAYLADKTAKKHALTQDEEDAELHDWYEKVWNGKLGYTDAEIQKSSAELFAQKVGTFGAKQRFMKFFQGYKNDDQDIIDSYKPLPGATPEEIEIARRVVVFGSEYFAKHPEITDRKEKIAILENIRKSKSSPYIDAAVSTLTTPQKIGAGIQQLFGKSPEKLNFADLMQSGSMQVSAETDSGVKKQMDDFMAEVLPTWYTANGFTTADQQKANQPILLTPSKRSEGKFKGLQPIAQVLSKDQKKVYQLWKDGADLAWYWLPVEKAKNAVDKDWTKLK